MPVGVRQGSNIGTSTVFDLCKWPSACHLARDIILYADDAVTYYSFKNVSDLESRIDANLQTVSKWFSISPHILIISKCNCIIFGSHPKLNNIQDFSVQLEVTCIERTVI